MKTYNVPIQFKKELKQIGNVLSFRQLLYICCGLGIGYTLTLPFPWTGYWFAVNLILIAFITGLSIPLGFVYIEKNDWYLDKYIKHKLMFYISKKDYPWKKRGEI